ncbi:hypothetical protein [Caldalkalibacillus mannanilyticus]|uniref:hypothetical protein n=1 Tax=Caldalkalibacillus mannanilyticus TaxID=1418 RepID=UPI0004692D3F|nr:hypothetical protein [Caldalkalibacillus mannanilyticus]
MKKALDNYPSTAYSKNKQVVYFTARTENDGVQLFKKDLRANAITQLTKELSYVDFLQYDETKNNIYMRVLVQESDQNFHMATYDLEHETLSVWNEQDKDTSVVEFDFNERTGQLLVVTRSIKEELDNTPSKIAEVDIRTQNLDIILEESKEYPRIRKPVYSLDRGGFYFIANGSGFGHSPVGVVKYYDLTSHEVFDIWTQKSGNAANIYIGNENEVLF